MDSPLKKLRCCGSLAPNEGEINRMSWYAVHTRSRHEEKVYEGLIRKSLHAFLPKVETWSRRKDRRKRILLPMFSGYLFVDVAALDNQTKLDILKTPGAVRILGRPSSAEAIPVPDEKIEAIRRIVESRVETFQLQYPHVGEPARIVDGPFRGVEGIVVSTDPEKELFVVSIDLLQRSVAIRLQGFQVAKL